jgi:hypothetical protein
MKGWSERAGPFRCGQRIGAIMGEEQGRAVARVMDGEAVLAGTEDAEAQDSMAQGVKAQGAQAKGSEAKGVGAKRDAAKYGASPRRAAGEEKVAAFLRGPRPRITMAQKEAFLMALIDSSCVTASAKAAGIDRGHVYRLRLRDEQFRLLWDLALLEGYAMLEMAMVGWARAALSGAQGEDAKAAIARERDVAAAMRLLGMHRARVAEIEARVQVLRGEGTGKRGERSGDEVARLLRARLLETRARLARGGDGAALAGLGGKGKAGKPHIPTKARRP